MLETAAAQGAPLVDDGHLNLGRTATALLFGETRPIEPSPQLDRIPWAYRIVDVAGPEFALARFCTKAPIVDRSRDSILSLAGHMPSNWKREIVTMRLSVISRLVRHLVDLGECLDG